MTTEEIKKYYPIGQRCMYYGNKLAQVRGYNYNPHTGEIGTLEVNVESGRGALLKFIAPNLKILKPF